MEEAFLRGFQDELQKLGFDGLQKQAFLGKALGYLGTAAKSLVSPSAWKGAFGPGTWTKGGLTGLGWTGDIPLGLVAGGALPAGGYLLGKRKGRQQAATPTA